MAVAVALCGCLWLWLSVAVAAVCSCLWLWLSLVASILDPPALWHMHMQNAHAHEHATCEIKRPCMHMVTSSVQRFTLVRSARAHVWLKQVTRHHQP